MLDEPLIEIPREEKSKKTYTCPQCNKVLASRGSLSNHLLTHSSEPSFTCDCCGKLFRLKTSLLNHINYQHGDPNYACNICHKKFRKNVQLSNHLLLHTGEKSHVCSIVSCDKTFRTKEQRLYHEQHVHCDSKLFTCSQCQHTFPTMHQCIEHSRLHEGGRSFQCTQCGKTFKAASQLKKHHRTHTNECPFTCQRCHKKFKDSSNLKRHTITCGKVKPPRAKRTYYHKPVEKDIVEKATSVCVAPETILVINNRDIDMSSHINVDTSEQVKQPMDLTCLSNGLTVGIPYYLPTILVQGKQELSEQMAYQSVMEVSSVALPHQELRPAYQLTQLHHQ